MSNAAFSLRVFSIYMFTLGVILVVNPNLLLSIFGITETNGVWVRVVGMLVLILGYLDFMSSRSEVIAFFRWSVYARLSIPVFFVVFITLGLAPPILILIGIIDATSAIWTAICLRNDRLNQ